MGTKAQATAPRIIVRKPSRSPSQIVAEYQDLDQVATIRNPEGDLSQEQAQEIACLMRGMLEGGECLSLRKNHES